jgi:hypothetical protein
MNRELLQKAYSEYLNEYATNHVLKGRLIRFDHFERLFKNRNESNLLVFSELTDSLTKALTNDINKFIYVLSRLDTWNSILKTYGDHDQRNMVAYTMVEPLFINALVAPYNLKQRIIYAASKLLVLRNTIEYQDIGRPIPEDHQIQRSTLTSWCMPTKAQSELMRRIDLIDSESFATNTRQFRRKEVHRLPQHLIYGIRTNIEIKKTNQGYSLTSYAERPLTIDEAYPHLITEHQLIRDAFVAYLTVVAEARDHLIALS